MSPLAMPRGLDYGQARARTGNYLGKKEYSFTSLESFIAAKVMVEALRRAGPRVTRESFMQALDGMAGFDTGGYPVSFSPTNHNGSDFVELTVISGGLKFAY